MNANAEIHALADELMSTGLYDRAGAEAEAAAQLGDLELFAEAWDDQAAWEEDEHYDLAAEIFVEGAGTLDEAHAVARLVRSALYQISAAWDRRALAVGRAA